MLLSAHYSRSEKQSAYRYTLHAIKFPFSAIEAVGLPLPIYYMYFVVVQKTSLLLISNLQATYKQLAKTYKLPYKLLFKRAVSAL